MKYFLIFGSNLGDREKNLTDALSLLEKEGVEVISVSSLYETQPVDLPSQPWFYNQVVEVKSNVNPKLLLELIKKIEKKMGREYHVNKGPRVIDMDILLAEDTVVQTKELIIPHPRMEERNFVLVPFAEISPDTVHPMLDERIGDLLRKSNDSSLVKKISTPIC